MKCSQDKCDNDSVASYVWPGRKGRMFACEACFRKTIAISETMGFDLGDVRREGVLRDEQPNRE